MALNPPARTVFSRVRNYLSDSETPSVNKVADQSRDPYRVLIATMISLRTKDEVTESASSRLFSVAPDAQTLARLPEERIAELIYPAGFYKTKARSLRKTASIICDRYDGSIPSDKEKLVELPGVGVKTANLTLNLGFGIAAICVDTHVHRISNRLGWVSTESPEKTEKALEKVLHESYWIEINALFVSYGKRVCTPVSPHCSLCPLETACPKKGVTRSR